MTILKKTAATLFLALAATGALTSASQAGYWVTTWCDPWTCYQEYVPTCGWYADGWGGWYYYCG
jgi:hypothetical protein